MKCPVCDEKLREVQKHGVAVDICPDCKGVWLDRGELEKILDMVAADGPDAELKSEYTRLPHASDDSRRQSGGHDYNEHSRAQTYPHKKRRCSWLGEILEGLGGD